MKILGVNYSVKLLSEKTEPRLKGLCGFFDSTAKEIIISKAAFEKSDKDVKEPGLILNNTLTHEIVHAFLHESGLTQECFDEQRVSWLAHMIDQIYICKEEAIDKYGWKDKS